ncbi:MAG: hypothetical protein ACOYJO_02000 [Eubacterium sp.]|jgi:hypothetical protein
MKVKPQGSKFLKVVAIIQIVFCVMILISVLISVTYLPALESIPEYESLLHDYGMTSTQLNNAFIFYGISAAVRLVLAILLLIFNRYDKAKTCMTLVIVMFAATVILAFVSAAATGTTPAGNISTSIFMPILFLIGALQLRSISNNAARSRQAWQNGQGPNMYRNDFSRGGYPPQGNYGPQGGYPPQGNYGPQGGYPPQGNYGPQGGYPPQGNYGPQGGYPPQGNYDQQGGYPPQGNYGPQGGYPPQGNYGPQGGYPPQGNYDQQGGYPPQSDYGQQDGYPKQTYKSPFDDMKKTENPFESDTNEGHGETDNTEKNEVDGGSQKQSGSDDNGTSYGEGSN